MDICRGILSGSPTSQSALIPPTIHCSSETDLEASISTTEEQTWQGCDYHRANRRPCSIIRAGSSHHNTNHTPNQRDSIITFGGKTWQPSILKIALATKSLDMQSHRDGSQFKTTTTNSPLRPQVDNYYS